MDELVDVITALIALVPDEGWHTTERLMAAAWVLGVVLAVVRPWLAKRVPAGRARWWLDALDLVLHAISASSKRLADRPAPPAKVAK